MGKVLKLVLIFASLILTASGITIYTLTKDNQNLKENTEIIIDGDVKKTFDVDFSDFYPGKSLEYKITLTTELNSDYKVYLEFLKDEDSNKLDEYLNLELNYSNEINTYKLNELFINKRLTLKENTNEIKMTYTMPINTPNEAQKTSVSFKLVFNISSS